MPRPRSGSRSLRAGASEAVGSIAGQDRRSAFQRYCLKIFGGQKRTAGNQSSRADSGSGCAPGLDAASRNSGAVRNALQGDRTFAAYSGTVFRARKNVIRTCRSYTWRQALSRSMRNRRRLPAPVAPPPVSVEPPAPTPAATARSRRCCERSGRCQQSGQGGGNYAQALPPGECRRCPQDGGERNRSELEDSALHCGLTQTWSAALERAGISHGRPDPR